MLKPLVWKESRELAPLVALALAIQVYLVAAPQEMQYLYSDPGDSIPFVGGSVNFLIFVVAGMAAFVLGLWQTVWESGRGTFHFLLHRPATRDAIFATKLAVGLVACLAIPVVPMAGYALWAAAPGTHASPFFWSMTTWVWTLSARMPLVYLGAFLSGLRPGSWFGSRFFPVATGVATLLALEAFDRWPLVQVSLALAAEGLFVVVILHVARVRDYS